MNSFLTSFFYFFFKYLSGTYKTLIYISFFFRELIYISYRVCYINMHKLEFTWNIVTDLTTVRINNIFKERKDEKSENNAQQFMMWQWWKFWPTVHYHHHYLLWVLTWWSEKNSAHENKSVVVTINFVYSIMNHGVQTFFWLENTHIPCNIVLSTIRVRFLYHAVRTLILFVF